jgi:hypothetical protein
LLPNSRDKRVSPRHIVSQNRPCQLLAFANPQLMAASPNRNHRVRPLAGAMMKAAKSKIGLAAIHPG